MAASMKLLRGTGSCVASLAGTSNTQSLTMYVRFSSTADSAFLILPQGNGGYGYNYLYVVGGKWKVVAQTASAVSAVANTWTLVEYRMSNQHFYVDGADVGLVPTNYQMTAVNGCSPEVDLNGANLYIDDLTFNGTLQNFDGAGWHTGWTDTLAGSSTVTQDTTVYHVTPAPAVIGAWQVDATHTAVYFDMAPVGSYNTASNYTIPGLTVSAAALQANTRIVLLTHGAATWNTEYTVTVNASVATGATVACTYYACWIAAGDEQQTTHPFAAQALVKGDYLFYCWLGSDLKARAQRMTISTGSFSSVWTSSDAIPSGDRHQFPSILIDQNNKVVVVHCPRWTGAAAYAARVCVASSNYDHATTPLNMGAWGEIGVSGNSGLDGSGAAFSYFNPAMYADGTVIATMRGDTVSANPWHAYFFKKAPTDAWTAGTLQVLAHNPSDSDNGVVLAYAQRPNITTISGTEYAAVAVLCTDGSSDYRGMAVIYTPDKGANWYSANGTLLTLPFATSSTARAADSILWPYNGYVSGGSVADAIFDTNGDLYAAVETANGTAATTTDCGFNVYRFPAGGSAWESITLDTSTTAHGGDPWGWGACPKFAIGGNVLLISNRETGSGETAKSTHLTMDAFAGSLSALTTMTIPQPEPDAAYWRDYFPQIAAAGNTAYLLWTRGYNALGGSLMGATFALVFDATLAFTVGDATAGGSTLAITADGTLALSVGDAVASGGVLSLTAGDAMLALAAGDSAADGGTFALTGVSNVTLALALGDAVAGGTTLALTSDGALVLSQGDASANGGSLTLLGVSNAALALAVGDAAADGGSLTLVATSNVSMLIAVGDATAGGGTLALTVAATVYPKAQSPALARTFAIFNLDADEKVCAVLSNADPNACPVWGDKHVRDLKGANTYEYSCAAMHPDAAFQTKLSQIVFRDLDGTPQLMTITKVERHMDGESKYLHVYAEHSAQELLNEPLTAVSYASQTTSTILAGLMAGTRWSPGQIDYDGTYTETFDYGSVLAAIRQHAATSTLEVSWRVDFSGSRITGRYVDFVTRLGRDTGKVIEVGKDLQGIVCTDDGAPIATAIYPIGKAAADGTRVTIAGVAWSKSAGDALDKVSASPILEYPEATQVWGVTPTRPRVLMREYPDILSSEALIHAAYTDLCGESGVAVPTPTYEIDVAVLEKAFGSTGWQDTHPYGREAMRLGDTVIVRDPTSPTSLMTPQRITRTEYAYSDIATATSIGG